MHTLGRKIGTGVLGAILAVAGVLAAPAAGVAAVPGQTTTPAPSAEAQSIVAATVVITNLVGYDISYPQCSKTLPAARPFAVIGVNGGKATTFNPCFGSELAWAQASSGGSEQPNAALYLNTGNPALAASWWPDSNATKAGTLVVNPKGTCAHTASAACAYVYGYSVAEADYAVVTAATTASFLWWLDVETSNTWQKNTSTNANSLAGMVAFLGSKGAPVGLYSTPSQWATIAGKTPSTSVFAKLPSWLAGASSSTAAKDCANKALTPSGHVTMVQYVSGGFDRNVSCHTFTSKTVTISGSALVGKKLTAVVATSAPGSIAVTYQWKTHGTSIPKAVKSYHTVTAGEAGKSITVTVTIKKTGYNSTSAASAAVLVAKR